jgi:hypothetical protein
MTDNRQIVDMIERANDAQPYCPCGWHTTPVWRDGVVWLECASLSEPRESLVDRLIAQLTSPVHIHFAIVEAPAATPRAKAA